MAFLKSNAHGEAREWAKQAEKTPKHCLGYGVILNFWDMDIIGNTAYVCQGNRLGIYDFSEAVANPDNPDIPNPVIQLSNFPNPFVVSTTITISGKTENTPCELSIYNLKGQKVKCLHSGYLSTETNSMHWNGMDEANRPVASGVYLSRLTQGNTTISKALLKIK